MNPGPDPAGHLLDGLTDEQREAVTTSASPLCIVAGAGSGKTRVLTRRIAWQAATGALDPRRAIAVTFTRRAATELRRRLRSLGLREQLAAGTFHSAALAILHRHWSEAGRRAPELLEHRIGFLARHNERVDRGTIANLASEIGWARARLVTPERYEEEASRADRRPPRGAGFTSEVYARYESTKRARRLVDFDDLLALCHATMRREERFAEAQHWRHRHLFVDEFQDVNPLQFALLQTWLGPESTLVVVGDPDQAIYGWNGADPDLIRDVDVHVPGAAVLYLRTNFRSSPEILAAAGRVLGRDPQPAVRPPGPPPTVTALDGAHEAVGIARAVRGAHRPGAPWSHQAVLARTNAQLLPVRAALESAGIPVRTRGQTSLLRRPEVAEIIERWDARNALSTQLADEGVDATIELDDGGQPERAAMAQAFVTLGHDHLALEPDATVDDFLATLRTDDRVASGIDAVELTTFHGAKGLEWPIVHLVGVERGYVPISRARTAEARLEEQRLLHVATTRAQRELHVTWCRTRRRGGSHVEREPSPWIDAFAAPDAEPPALPPVADLRDRFVGPPNGGVDTDASAIRDALESWRAAAAHAARVEPAAVLPDATLDTLVDLRPSTTGDLAGISGIGRGKAERFGDQLLELLGGRD